MPYSYKIIRGASVRQSNILSLAIRHGFPEQSESLKEAGDDEQSGWREETEKREMARAGTVAEEIIQKARATAEKITEEAREQARLQAQVMAQEAREEGFQAGYQDGYQSALAEAGQKARAIREEAVKVLKQVRQIWRNTLDSMEEEIVLLAREIAEKILTTQLTLNPEMVPAIVRESLRSARNKEQVVLYVNPGQIDLAFEHRQELQQVLLPEAALHIIADADVEPGGCRVETEDSKIDATLPARWQAVLKALPPREAKGESELL